ncbi:MAG: nucleotidyltransferase domain-containing protein [Actinomycetota bacterium]|nr:nucleotidyltransferase domain-containing protein [Actinomycetota bacterium]
MVKADPSTLNIIDRFIKALSKKINVKKVILYGSHVSGHLHEWSDIDLAVISDDFKEMDVRDRLLMLSKIAWMEQATEIDALGYTEEEFEVDDPLSLASEIKENGIVVYKNN